MLYLKPANTDDIEKEYLFVRDIPEDENGFINEYHGISREDFDAGVTYLDLMRRNLDSLKKAVD